MESRPLSRFVTPMPNATQAQIEETFRWLEKLEATQTEGLAPLPGLSNSLIA